MCYVNNEERHDCDDMIVGIGLSDGKFLNDRKEGKAIKILGYESRLGFSKGDESESIKGVL